MIPKTGTSLRLRLLPILFCAVGVASDRCDAQAGAHAASRALFEKVKVIYAANQNGIRSVACDYTLDMAGLQRRCRYRRQADRIYHASVDSAPNGAVSLPTELAWDGQVVTRRPSVNLFTRSRNRELVKPTCPPPEVELNTYLTQALGYAAGAGQSYHLISARVTPWDEQECVELQFSADWLRGKLVSRHLAKANYLPVSAELFDQAGERVYELRDVRYATREVEGNRLVYPISFMSRAWVAAGAPPNTLTYQVDEATLSINEPIPASQFVLKPWPSDAVSDLDTLQSAPPQDSHWSPAANVAFPYDVFFSRPTNTAAALGSASVDQQVTGGGILREQSERRLAWFVSACGIVVLIAGVMVRLRTGRRSNRGC